MSRRRIKALLLAGGLGTRLRPVTLTTPKCLVEIAGRPLLDYWFDAMGDAGIGDVLINTHHLPEPMRQYMARCNRQGRFRVSETFEPTLLGSAGTIHANRDWADDADHVVIIYADNLSTVDLASMIEFHCGHVDPFTMLLFHAANPGACGIATLQGDRIVGFVEKPEHPVSDLANAGVYVVTADAYRQIADMDRFDLGFDVLPRFIDRMRGFVLEGYHRDIGSLDALEHAQREAPEHFAVARENHS